MSAIEAKEAGSDAKPPAPLMRALRWLAAIFLVAGIAGAIGFVWFVGKIAPAEIALSEQADGIVVLTGGSARIVDAIELLARGNGKRLLISGVEPTTDLKEIVKLHPERAASVLCCVDLDPKAVNTLGNAVETRRWATKLGLKSLIVVTSNYHMPRAMAELRHQLPNMTLTPFPVASVRFPAVWRDGVAVRLLMTEYVKYMLAVARMWVPALDRMST